MRLLPVVSTISALCAVPILLFVVPQLVASGVVEVGGSVEYMVVLPTLIGCPVRSSEPSSGWPVPSGGALTGRRRPS